jgi:hypothetical protein
MTNGPTHSDKQEWGKVVADMLQKPQVAEFKRNLREKVVADLLQDPQVAEFKRNLRERVVADLLPEPQAAEFKRNLLFQAKEDLEKWARKRFWILSAVFGIVGLASAAAIAQLVLQTTIQANIEGFQNRLWQGSQHQFDAFEERAKDMHNRLVTATTNAEASTQLTKDTLEQVRTLQNNVSAALLQLQKLRTDVAAVQLDFEKKIAEASVLSTEERALIRIKVVPLRTNSQNDSGRVLTRLTYSVDVPDKDSQHFLNSIERVVYILDPLWFTPNQIERHDPETRFSFSIDVWGYTNVKAHVYLRKGGDPIDFEGRMNLNEVSYLPRL